ncbi:hypothetical protein [Pseudomonas sp.]|uniref:hypothetical protein n=1 Tax=Pseudomonas sp. TaxID=306 RepID=UPI0028B105E2|nr:hypothetical protein [Pseudomonas sp.]
MNKLVVPAAIFVSVLGVGQVCEHYGMSANWKIGVLCIVALVVQITVSRFQRRQGPDQH